MKLVEIDCNNSLLQLFAEDKFDVSLSAEKGLCDYTYFQVRFANLSNEVLGSFALAPLPGNCGVVVSTATMISHSYRGKGWSRTLHKFKESLAIKLGYKIMLSTVVWDNEPQLRSATKAGWCTVKHFVNKRTSNPTHLMVKELQ